MKYDDMLQHFGILGMKWGRSKGKTSKTSSKKTKAVKNDEDYDFKESIKGKKASELSNAQLKKFAERSMLEKQYKDLTKKQMSAGKKYVVDLLVGIAKEQATAFVKQAVTKAVTRAPAAR